MMDDQDTQVELVERVSLNPHEMIIPTNLEKRLAKLRKIGFYKPIIVDSETMVILDGHHKWNAAGILGLINVPVLKVGYLQSNSIEVETWPDCGRAEITKEEVIGMGLSGELFPPKTSRHFFPFEIPQIRIPLDELK
tara:strand:+ start:697 stop:1107 length:411 start_codon:yes stop_codon:yes gene_type:complete